MLDCFAGVTMGGGVGAEPVLTGGAGVLPDTLGVSVSLVPHPPMVISRIIGRLVRRKIFRSIFILVSEDLPFSGLGNYRWEGHSHP